MRPVFCHRARRFLAPRHSFGTGGAVSRMRGVLVGSVLVLGRAERRDRLGCPLVLPFRSRFGIWRRELGESGARSRELRIPRGSGANPHPISGAGDPTSAPPPTQGGRSPNSRRLRSLAWGRRRSVGTGAPLGDIWGPEPERCSLASRSPCRLPVKPRPRPWLPGIGSSWKVSGRVLPAREAPTCTRGRRCFQGVGCGNARGLSGEVE